MARAYAGMPRPELWLWPFLEVLFVAAFSMAPIPITAINTSLHSPGPGPVDWYTPFYKLIDSGQLMYYSLGFVASAAWILLLTIRRPRIMLPLTFLLIVADVIVVAITIGIDPTAAHLNAAAFRSASYWVFGISILTFLIINTLKEWQPLPNLEEKNQNQDDDFTKKAGAQWRAGL